MALKDIERIEHTVDLAEFHGVHVWIWRLQYVFMALFITAALLTFAGFFGEGPASRTVLSDAGAEITYQRFARYGKEVLLEVRLPPGTRRVAIPLDYFESFKLDAAVPAPQRQGVREGRILFEFDANGAALVRFHLLPRRAGITETSIGAGAANFTLTQFTWP